jgi:ammonium transporter, Amt family
LRSSLKLAGTTVLATVATLVATTGFAFADSTGSDIIKDVGDLKGTNVAMNLLWIIIGAVLVIFMQAGFALVETGFCRAKHAAHVVATNFAIFGLGFIAFFVVGYGFMFGAYSATIGADSVPVIGTYLQPVGHWLIGSGHTGILAWGPPALSGKSLDVGVMAFFLYMVAFMDTTATIPTGSMAERWKWKSFCMWGIFCGAIYYPLFGAMTWGGGWLAQLGNSHGLGLGSSTSPGRVLCTPWAVLLLSPVPLCSVLASASSAQTARLAPLPVTTFRWRCSARSSSCSVGSASTRHPRSLLLIPGSSS